MHIFRTTVYNQHCFICRPSDSTLPTDAVAFVLKHIRIHHHSNDNSRAGSPLLSTYVVSIWMFLSSVFIYSPSNPILNLFYASSHKIPPFQGQSSVSAGLRFRGGGRVSLPLLLKVIVRVTFIDRDLLLFGSFHVPPACSRRATRPLAPCIMQELVAASPF